MMHLVMKRIMQRLDAIEDRLRGLEQKKHQI
jgi:hypothetical protein